MEVAICFETNICLILVKVCSSQNWLQRRFSMFHQNWCQFLRFCAASSTSATASPTHFAFIHLKQVQIYPPNVIFWHVWHTFPLGSLNAGRMDFCLTLRHMWLRVIKCDDSIGEDCNVDVMDDDRLLMIWMMVFTIFGLEAGPPTGQTTR